jgi:hypothetical protein
MKTYNSRQELSEDIDFLKMTLLDLETTSRYVDELFHQWKNTSPDSPWYENRILMEEKEKKAVETLIKISDEGISNQWSGEHIVFRDL